ncbi:hypothetical protein Taro_052147 [Colocasia esculenta]|uniref:Uncharacterized protein n=1 Tax=Colocasia esculenta TaxID=4460 RepID=A0A843XJC8_COLES|nr:hypothetical protein [Colocasia esculenta]
MFRVVGMEDPEMVPGLGFLPKKATVSAVTTRSRQDDLSRQGLLSRHIVASRLEGGHGLCRDRNQRFCFAELQLDLSSVTARLRVLPVEVCLGVGTVVIVN